MKILIAALAVVFAAFCFWLTVRFINRREKWAKWTLPAVVGVPVLYVASFGPASWWFSTVHFSKRRNVSIARAPSIYLPIGWAYQCSDEMDIERLDTAI